MCANNNANEHARTDDRTAEASRAKVSLLQALEVGDEVLYRAGSGKGTTDPVQPLTVTEVDRRAAFQQPHIKADDDEMMAAEHERTDTSDEPHDFNTEDVTAVWENHIYKKCPHDHHYGNCKPSDDDDRPGASICRLQVKYATDEWYAMVEGPQGGEYKLVEDDGDVYHSAISHDGLGGTLRWLSLEARDDDEDAAQEAFDAALHTDETTTRHGDRDIVFTEPAGDISPVDPDLNYRVEINDDDEFVVTPTHNTETLHIYTKEGVNGRGRQVYTHVFFEDDFHLFKEQGLKDDVFKKGGSLDWDIAHQECHPDRDWQWSVSYDAMDYVLEHLAERGHAITVDGDLARRAGNEHYATENPGAQVPGLDADGCPVDGITVREQAADDDEPETSEGTDDDNDDDSTDVRAESDDESADVDKSDPIARMGTRMCDGGTVERAMAQEKPGYDKLTDDGGVGLTDILRLANDHDRDPVSVAEGLDEYGLYPVDSGGERLSIEEIEMLT